MRYNFFVFAVGVCATLAQAQTFSPKQRPKLADGYVRYDVPGRCLAAAQREMVEAWKGSTFTDTLTYAAMLKHELIPPSAVRAARQCVMRMQTATLQPPDHIGMVELALLAERNDLKTRFLDSVIRRVAAVRESEHRTWLVERLVQAYPGGIWVEFEPLRHPEVLMRLLSLVPCADYTLCQARLRLLFLLRRDARARGEFAAASAYADSLISLQRQVNRLPDVMRDETGRLGVWPRNDFFYSLSWWYDDTTLVTGPVSGSAGVQPAWERVRKGLAEVGDNPDNPLIEYPEGNRHYRFMDSLFRLNTPVKFPALAPKAWIGPTGVASAPAPGRVLLIIEKAQPLVFNHPWGNLKFPAVTAMLRRLHRKYAASGFDIVWVMASQGHFKGSSVLTFDEEQKALAAYWFGRYNVPGVIALDQTTFTRRSDNRLFPQRASSGVAGALTGLSARAGGKLGGMYLVDRNGNLSTPVVLMDTGRDAEIALGRMIERALGKSAD